MNALTKTLTTSSTTTMSSLEIAELTGKAHHHVMRDIREVLEAIGDRPSKFGYTIERPNPKGGRPIPSPCYRLPKDLVFTLVTGYSVQLRHKVVTRWMELEAAAYAAPAAALPAPYAIPQSFAQALQLAADQAKLIEEQGVLNFEHTPYTHRQNGQTLPTAPIVHTEGRRVFATSKDVAAYFGKQHYNVIKAVERILETHPSFAVNFNGIEIEARVGFGHRRDPAYEMDRKGFVLLAMGFTGAKAMGFKSKYIDAFDEAERRLKELEVLD